MEETSTSVSTLIFFAKHYPDFSNDCGDLILKLATDDMIRVLKKIKQEKPLLKRDCRKILKRISKLKDTHCSVCRKPYLHREGVSDTVADVCWLCTNDQHRPDSV